MTRTLRVVSLLCVALAGLALAQEPAAPAAADRCAAARWTLQGASDRPDEGLAAFVPAWTPLLEEIAACARSPAHRDACLLVLGHADEVPFRDTMVTALGSQEAAQVARAHGRASVVIARLEDLGVGAERIREGPPVLRSAVRGVEIRAVPGCIDAAAREAADAAVLAALVDRRVAEAIAAHEARPAGPVASGAQETAPALEEVEEIEEPHRFFADATLDATLLGVDPSTVFAPALQLGLGWRPGRAVVRLGAGAAFGSEREQRIGFEASLYGGWALARWIELGPQLRYRISSLQASDPWLEQAFTLGVQASHCLWTVGGSDLCLTEAVLPLGVRHTQGTVTDGEPVRASWEATYNAEVLVGVALRKGF